MRGGLAGGAVKGVFAVARHRRGLAAAAGAIQSHALGAAIVGSPDTVYRQIIDLVRETQVGNLLIQFHMGNMRDDLARKSMRLFATQVAPRLRQDSRVAFEKSFGELAEAT